MYCEGEVADGKGKLEDVEILAHCFLQGGPAEASKAKYTGPFFRSPASEFWISVHGCGGNSRGRGADVYHPATPTRLLATTGVKRWGAWHQKRATSRLVEEQRGKDRLIVQGGEKKHRLMPPTRTKISLKNWVITWESLCRGGEQGLFS
jgi:hypothetical protein